MAPQYLAYALSFTVIGLSWAHSHFSGKIVRKADHGFSLLTLLFLALVSITPFPARFFAEHLADGANSRTAATVYTCVLTAPAVAWLARWVYVAGHGLLDPRLAEAYARGLTLKYALTAAVSGVGAALAAFVDWRLGLGLTALVILSYLLPPTAPQYKPGQKPQDELEEAGESPD